MKVLLYEDLTRYNEALAAYNNRLKPLQTALDAYTALGIATVPTVAELAELQESPHLFLLKMMTNRQPLSLVGGVTIAPQQFWDMMDKPAGVPEFVALVKSLYASDGYISNRVNVADIERVNGQLQLTQAVKDLLKEQSRTYATQQEQLDEWAQVQIIVEALNTIRQLPSSGQSFETKTYLGRVLKRGGYAAGGNPVEADVQAFLSK